jgi:hypothetical protein
VAFAHLNCIYFSLDVYSYNASYFIVCIVSNSEHISKVTIPHTGSSTAASQEGFTPCFIVHIVHHPASKGTSPAGGEPPESRDIGNSRAK